MASVRALREVRVYARDRDRLEGFVARLQGQVDAEILASASVAAAVEGADVVSAATSASAPVFDGGVLAAGVHVNGVGSFRLDMRELDQRTIERAIQEAVRMGVPSPSRHMARIAPPSPAAPRQPGDQSSRDESSCDESSRDDQQDTRILSDRPWHRAHVSFHGIACDESRPPRWWVPCAHMSHHLRT